ncbi:outer membrane insertion C-terminal signal [Flavobacterium fluvii]|uniref:Outer membrane insertion C-terminal signal n=1 Tax=Flavobacterium fluvii TaxID=468056 RepID=A0A1M5EQN9_9FLAO|nr:DUF3078 domain-containing protein [Flavobacterium fluvii]SHF81342.1 outer membrane insertion C-terminal signal [Flavobacterium fluvii]
MKKIILLGLLLGLSTKIYAQTAAEKELIKKTEEAAKIIDDTIKGGWKYQGKVTFLFNQANFNNWVAGGENSFSGNLGLDYKIDYKKDKFSWENRILASYGVLQTQNASFEKKTDDQIEINSIVAQRTNGYWYYSFLANFRTQFTKGYVYSKDVNGAEIRQENTNFMSPGYLLFGPGMYWKKNENLKLNFAPLTSKFTFVDSFYTSIPGYLNNSYFGVDANKSVLYQLGFNATAYYKFNIMENVSAENLLNLYSNYLEKPQNIDINYTLNIVMKINKVLSANLNFQAIYDDDAFAGFQTKEVFGVGVNYSFFN